VTPTTLSPSPSANSISVADGTRLAIRMETTMALLDDDDITTRLDALPGWERDGDAIAREFKFDDFQGSVDFVNRITPPAEEMNHHPDIAISWNKVTLTLSTHSEGGLTENDFELATRIDSLA
jgi:4a-hydroxytetrahydrobiopterin dehydratase